MITKDEIQALLHCTETYRVERTVSTGDMDKFQEAICAFANDFPNVNDYRNPLVASAMKTMGYVNMFNRGVGQVQTDLKENKNKPALFDVRLITAFKVNVFSTFGDTQDVPSLSPALSPAVPNLSQVCPKLLLDNCDSAIIAIFMVKDKPLPIISLMEAVGEKNRSRYRQNILKPLMDGDIIEQTIKDIPNSPKQKYALTNKGKELLNKIAEGTKN